MTQLVDEAVKTRVHLLQGRSGGPADPASALSLTFQPAFEAAIRESLGAGTPVEAHPEGLPFPWNVSELQRFCEQALSECPIAIEYSLLNGRRVHLSLRWSVEEGSPVISLRAADITEEERGEGLEEDQPTQREIDRRIAAREAEKQLRDSEERYRASF